MNLPEKLKLNLTFEEMIREGMIDDVVLEHIKDLQEKLEGEEEVNKNLRGIIEDLEDEILELESELDDHRYN